MRSCGLAPTPTRLPWFVSSDIATLAVAALSRAPNMLWAKKLIHLLRISYYCQ